MEFKNTTGEYAPPEQHFGLDLMSWAIGITYCSGWIIQLGPLYWVSKTTDPKWLAILEEAKDEA